MSSNWETVKLGDYCSKIGSGSTPRGGSSIYLDIGQFALIRSQNILNNSFSINGLVYIDENEANKLKNVSVEENDVLLNITGDSVARVCKAPKEYLPARVNQHVAIIRADEINLDSSYLNYYLNSLDMQNYMLSLASTGATRNALTKNMIENFEIIKPPLPTQKKIAHILSTLDDKIELNRKMNQTLESMASAIFKSWFVDFDPVHAKANCEDEAELENIAKELGISKAILDLFPSEFIESELGMIPKGWEWNKITEVCSSIGSGGTPKRMEDDNFNGEINWFTTKELQNSFVLKSIETITEKGLNTSSAKLFPVNTIVMAIYAAPTVGRLGILTEASTFNQAACGFVADEDKISYEFLFLFLQEKNEYLNNLANGAAQQNLNVGIVKNLDVLVANTNIMQTFKNITKNIFSQIKSNIQQIQALQKTRDTLLPKLLSGEIDVSELAL